MYESPIEMKMRELHSTMVETADEMIVKAVQDVGITVDKDELIKALQYDRGQYEKGYGDAMEAMQPVLRAAKQLLGKYKEERKKQLVAMRVAAETAAERMDIRKLKYQDDKEIEMYAKIFETAE